MLTPPRTLKLVLAVVLVGFASRAHADSRLRGVNSNVLAAGKAHALLLQQGGRFSDIWGADGLSTKKTPVALGDYGQVAAGASFSLAIDHFGTLLGWGLNSSHQAGTATTNPVTSPTPIGSANNWKWVAAGATHGLAINGGGALFAWGQNSDGEIGLGTTSASVTAPTAVAPASRWLTAAGGNQFSLAIQSNGGLWSWGHNASGQLGNGNTTAQHSPVQVTSSVPWVGVSAGDSHAVGIKGDGTLWAWGLNDQGQLGCGACTSPQKAPVQITTPAGQWIAVSAAGKTSYALRSDGTLWAWGSNNHGQLGCGSCASPQKAPVQVASGYEYVAAGFDFAVGVTTDGSVWTWGNNASGQLGNGNTTSTTTPARLPDNANGVFRAVKPAALVGGSATNAAHVKNSGVLETWGAFSDGGLGLGATLPNGLGQTAQSCDVPDAICWSPVPVLTSQVFKQVTATTSSMVAIRTDGTLWAWGGAKSVPTQISTATWIQVVNQYGALFALRADGTMWTWNGTYGAALTQVCASGACGGHTWATVSSGGEATLAIATDGTLWGWTHTGGTDDGDLLNDTTMNAAPVNLVPYGPAGWSTTWIDAEASLQDVSAVDCNGDLWGWGYDPYGEIGDGVENPDGPTRTPAKVLGNVVKVSRCGESAIATDVASNFFLWGHNQAGELGTGFDAGSSEGPVDWVTNALTGVRPGKGNTIDPQFSQFVWSSVQPPVLAIGCGPISSFVEDSDSTIWAAGDNTNGELGISLQTMQSYQFGQQQLVMYPDNVSPSGTSASINNGGAGNVNTGGGAWTTSPTKQASGQWFQASFPAPTYLSGITLVAASATTYPVSYAVSVSTDGSHFTTIASTSGVGQYMSIMFPLQFAQFVRITLTGSSTNTWDITQLEGLY